MRFSVKSYIHERLSFERIKIFETLHSFFISVIFYFEGVKSIRTKT